MREKKTFTANILPISKTALRRKESEGASRRTMQKGDYFINIKSCGVEENNGEAGCWWRIFARRTRRKWAGYLKFTFICIFVSFNSVFQRWVFAVGLSECEIIQFVVGAEKFPLLFITLFCWTTMKFIREKRRLIYVQMSEKGASINMEMDQPPASTMTIRISNSVFGAAWMF